MWGREAVASGENGMGEKGGVRDATCGVLKRNILNREPWQKKHSRWHWQDQEYSVVMMIECVLVVTYGIVNGNGEFLIPNFPSGFP